MILCQVFGGQAAKTQAMRRNLILVGDVAWTGMAAALLPDPLWDRVEPFLPTPPRRPKGGRPRISDRACLTGILAPMWNAIRSS
jgi:hypothetical protein